MASAGTDIFALAHGRLLYARQVGDCPNWGWVMVVEHTLPDQTRACSIYGHCQPAPGVTVGQYVTKGQHIAEIVHYSCWADHIHWGIYLGPFGAPQDTYPPWLHGYLPDGVTCVGWPDPWPGNYTEPVQFVISHLVPLLPESLGQLKALYK